VTAQAHRPAPQYLRDLTLRRTAERGAQLAAQEQQLLEQLRALQLERRRVQAEYFAQLMEDRPLPEGIAHFSGGPMVSTDVEVLRRVVARWDTTPELPLNPGDETAIENARTG
jgi:hypothetical protein